MKNANITFSENSRNFSALTLKKKKSILSNTDSVHSLFCFIFFVFPDDIEKY